MKKQFTTALCSLLITASAQADCPEVTVSNLATVACATAAKPYKSSPLSKMSYVAETLCPKGIGIRKMFQGVRDSGKKYPGIQISQTPGQAVCTYSLDPKWQKALTTTDTTLTLTSSIDTVEAANFLHKAKCPPLTAKEFDAIETGGSIEVDHTRNEKVKYEFHVKPLKKASAGARIKEFFNTKDIMLVNLAGQMTVTKPFEQKCAYTHHTGGSATELILRGVQDGAKRP